MAEFVIHPIGYELLGIPPSSLYRAPQVLREHDDEQRWIIVIPPRHELMGALVVDRKGDLIGYYGDPDEDYMRFKTPETAAVYLEENWRRFRKCGLQPELAIDDPREGEEGEGTWKKG